MRILIFIFVLACCQLASNVSRAQLQQFTAGVPVLDTVLTLIPYSQDSCAPDFDVTLYADIFDVTGVDLYLVVDSIIAPLGSVSTVPGSIVTVGDTLPVPPLDTNVGGYAFYFSQGGGAVMCRLMAEGIPMVPGEIYACDSFLVLITSALCSNDMGISALTTCSVACSGPPVAGFKNKISGSGSGFLSDFSDTSMYASSWYWDFGDGSFDTTQNAVHVYADSGDYTVCLVVSNACGVDTICKTITAYCEAPVANFDTFYVGAGVDFFDSSTAATSWLWDFGDGNQSTLEQPFNLYLDTGTYTVCLIAGNSCSLDTICKNVTITCALPVAGFTPNIAIGLDEIYFLDESQGALTWNWNFDDGNQSTVQSPYYTYAIAGTYDVCLTVTNVCGADTICYSVNATVTGIEEKISENRLSISPNPFSSTSIIELPNHQEISYSELTVINTLGVVVGKYDLADQSQFILQAEHLPIGMYTLRITTVKGASYLGKVLVVR